MHGVRDLPLCSAPLLLCAFALKYFLPSLTLRACDLLVEADGDGFGFGVGFEAFFAEFAAEA